MNNSRVRISPTDYIGCIQRISEPIIRGTKKLEDRHVSDKAKDDEARRTPHIPPSVFRPLIKTNPKVEMVNSPLMVQLTNTTLAFLITQVDAEIKFAGSSRPQPTENTTSEVPPIISTSHPKPLVNQRKGKDIFIEEQPKVQTKLIKASMVVREDPDEPIRVPYMINGKLYNFTNDEINANLEKEDQIKRDAEVAKSLQMTKTKVIKIVKEEAEKMGINPKKVINAKAGKKFKKAQDAKMKVHKRQHTEKVKRLTELNKKRAEQYMWTIKRKRMELEPEIKVPELECNQSLSEGVPFVNNMVIEEPEYGKKEEANGTGARNQNQAFQRWNDIQKVRVESLVSYLVMAAMVKTPKNARFGLKLKKLIAEHPDQENLQSKRVKLEAFGYKLD
nr:hypothetical protein [Tanacetum cinerariifolium]